jgi:hypothetical protein
MAGQVAAEKELTAAQAPVVAIQYFLQLHPLVVVVEELAVLVLQLQTLLVVVLVVAVVA